MILKPTPLLLPLSWPYGLAVAARNWLYDRGVFKVASVGIPVVSVGNISAGGTGKTPFVEMLVRMLLTLRVRPAVLSRGYGRKTSGYQVVSNGRQRCAEASSAGDEPAQMAEKLTGAVVVVDEDRVQGARRVEKEFRPDIIVLDDGFQHRRLARDLDIVLVSAREAVDRTPLLPAGFLREPWSSLKRATMVVVTKADSPDHLRRASEALAKYVGEPVLAARTEVMNIRGLGSVEARIVKDRKVVAVSGIADPDAFEDTVKRAGALLVDHLRFPDHHWFTGDELRSIRARFAELGADCVVTTEKDEMRLLGVPGIEEFRGQTRCIVLEVGSTLFEGEDVLRRMLQSILKTKGSS